MLQKVPIIIGDVTSKVWDSTCIWILSWERGIFDKDFYQRYKNECLWIL